MRPEKLARFSRSGAIIEKELSSATLVAETADGGLMPSRLVASPAAGAESHPGSDQTNGGQS
jgi:hypothetical protein